MPRFQDPYADAADKFSSPRPENQQESEYKPLSVLGEIREKGFGGAAGHPPSLPQITVLPFPVARHRSHGPHWAPLCSTSTRNEYDEGGEENDEENEIPVDGRASAQALHSKKPKGGLSFGNWRELLAKPASGSTSTSTTTTTTRRAPSVEEEIDAENRGRVLSMTPEEIADAQRELLERLGSEKLSMLRRRGAEKQKHRRASPTTTGRNSPAAELPKPGEAMEIDGEARNVPREQSSPSTSSTAGAPKLGDEAMGVEETKPEESRPGDSTKSFDSAWVERVEAVKLLRFDLAGFVTGKDEDYEPARVPGVSERDILRTEGDPAALGYTIKEAAALSRSTISGQRVAGLQLLAAVLHNAASGLKSERHGDETDWQAVWAYSLGPHPELVLTLRLELDDAHLTALNCCAKALYNLLSCSENEKYFNSAEALWPGEPLLYTAPVFRQRKTVDDGFLGAGNWKYNIKSSELFSKHGSPVEEDDSTVGDDATVASKDAAGGLIRMGILPRIRYILEVEKLRSAEESLLSVIICLARHSPAAAEAIMQCPRLMDVVVSGFLLQNDCLETTRAKAIELLKVLSQASRDYCLIFANTGALQAASSELFKGNSPGESSRRALVESLRLWRVCMQHGLGISMFSDFYPALSFRMLPSAEASFERQEAYNVLEILARKLPALNEEQQRETQAGWSWSIAVPIVSSSLEWLLPGEEEGGGVKVEIIGSVLHFLATICERVLEKDFSRHAWLPEFVPLLGLAFVRSKLFNFHGGRSSGETLVSSCLSIIRSAGNPEKLFPFVNSIRAAVRLALAVDKLLAQARRSSSGVEDGASEDEMILHSGLVSSARHELQQLVVMADEIEKARVRLEEFNGRGGPAPGIGFGWGALRGGFFSPELLLARSYAGILLDLDCALRPSLESKMSFCRVLFEPALIRRILSENVFSREQWDSTLARAFHRLKKRMYEVSELEAGRELLIQHYTQHWLERKGKKRKQESAEFGLSTIPENEEDEEEEVLLSEWNRMKLPLPAHWILSALHSGMMMNSGDDSSRRARVLAGLLLLLGADENSSLVKSSRGVHGLSAVFADGDLFLDNFIGELLRELQDGIDDSGASLQLDFEREVDPNYARFSEMLALNFTSSSFGDVSFGRQLAFYLRPRVAFSIQKSVWRVLAEAKMLGLLPSIKDCPGPSSAYLEPPQRNVEAIEMYVSAWTSGGLDKAFARGALSFELALHHVRRFIFEEESGVIHQRKKMIRSIIRSIRRSPASQEMFRELLRVSSVEERLFIEEACDGDPSLGDWRRFVAE